MPVPSTGVRLDQSVETGGKGGSAPARLSGTHMPKKPDSLVRPSSAPTKFDPTTKKGLIGFRKALEMQLVLDEAGSFTLPDLLQEFVLENETDDQLLRQVVASLHSNQVLGRGSFGAVYQNTGVTAGTQVIKIVLPKTQPELVDTILEAFMQSYVQTSCPGAAPRFTQVKLIRDSHLNAQQYTQYSPDYDAILQEFGSEYRVYIFMEGFDMNLLEYMRKPPREGDNKAKNMAIIFETLLTHLECMKTHYICHTDLKPANIMLKLDESKNVVEVRLIDFSPTLLRDHPEKGAPPTGTPRYTAPECWGVPIPRSKTTEELTDGFSRVGLRSIAPSCNVWSFAIIFVEYYAILRDGFTDMFRTDFGDVYNAMEYVIKLQRIALHKNTDYLVQKMVTFLSTAMGGRGFEDVKDVISQCFHTDAGRRPTPSELQSVIQRTVLLELYTGKRGHLGEADPPPAPRGPRPPNSFLEATISFNISTERVHILTDIPEENVRYLSPSGTVSDTEEIIYRDQTGSIVIQEYIKITGYENDGGRTAFYIVSYYLSGMRGVHRLRYTDFELIRNQMIAFHPKSRPRLDKVSFPSKYSRTSAESRKVSLEQWLQDIVKIPHAKEKLAGILNQRPQYDPSTALMDYGESDAR